MNIEFGDERIEYDLVCIGLVFTTGKNEVYLKIAEVVKDDCVFRCVRLRDGLLEDFDSKELVKVLNSKLTVW